MKATLASFKSFFLEDFNALSYFGILLFMTGLIVFNYWLDFEDSYIDQYKGQFLGWLFYVLFYVGIYLVALLLMKNNPSVKKALKTPKFYFFLFPGFWSILH